MNKDNYSKRGHFVIFGPANVGKSTIIGYILTHNLSNERFDTEVQKIKSTIGDNFQNNRLYSYFLDEAKDEYKKNSDNSLGNTYGTSKYIHIKSTGDFVLIDTPGGSEYESQRYKGLALATVGIFAIEVKQLLSLQEKRIQGASQEYLRSIKEFFCAWYVWEKLHGADTTIIVLTKCDLVNMPDDYETAKEVLHDILGDHIDKCAIIPTAVYLDSRRDSNIYTPVKDWYNGHTLDQEIRKKYNNIPDQISSEKLLAFYSKRDKDSDKCIFWKINQGTLTSDKKYLIAPVQIKDIFSTKVSSVRIVSEDNANSCIPDGSLIGYPGEIVKAIISQGVYNNTPLSKDNFGILNSSIIVEQDDKVLFGNEVTVTISILSCNSAEKQRLGAFRSGTQLSLLWFSKIHSTSVIDIQLSDDICTLNLKINNTAIALPVRLLPKKTLVQFLPGNDYELPLNFECNVEKIK